VNGEGGIGPILNDQMKLFQHLNEDYLETVLEVGGRYVCGNPRSVMPAWAEPNGPLNYVQIEDLIAFIRAPSTQEYQRRDPELNEPVLDAEGNVLTFKGWRDPEFRPDPASTPVPACHSGTPGGTPAPQPTLPTDATVVDLTAEAIAFEPLELTVPAGEVFGIHFIQKDTGVGGHDVDIRVARGDPKLFDGPVLLDPGEQTLTIGPLEPGTYNFFCSVHDIDRMNGTLRVE
jgi:plastocyanin